MKPEFKYNAFGLNIQSAFEIPELPLSDFLEPDVTIKFGKNPTQLENFKGEGVLYQAKKNHFLFRLDTVGSYLVVKGNSIIVERLNEATDEELRLFLLGSALGALMHQRSLLPFHGSTVVKNGKAIVIGGNSGAGKSSLAATLVKRGYQILSDDISVIESEDGEAKVYPGIPHLKLWHDVMEKLGEDVGIYPKVRPQLLKYRKPADRNFCNKIVTLGCIIILSSKNTPGFEINQERGIDKFNLLKNNTYRYNYLEGLEQTEEHFKMISQLAGCSNVYKVQRPITPLLLDELASFIAEKIEIY